MTAIFAFLASRHCSTITINPQPDRPRSESAAATPLRRFITLCAGGLLAAFLLAACQPNLGSSIKGWTPATASQGSVYVVTQDGDVKALADNGFGGVRLRWTFSAGEDRLVGSYNTPVAGYGLVYVSGIDGVLYALDQESGTLSGNGWAQPQDQDSDRSPLVGSPAVDETRGLVVVGSEDGNLYGFRARTGERLWQFASEDKIWTTPVISNGVVYIGSHDRNVYAVDAETGAEKWRFTTGGSVVAKPLLMRDMVVIGSFDRKLYALDARTGTNLWTFEGAANWYWAGAVASANAIYAASMDGNVYAVDRGGSLLWKHDLGDPIVATPVLLPSGLVVATREGKISLLNPAPGEIGAEREISSLSVDPAEIKAPIFALPVNEGALSQSGIQDRSDDQRESVYIGAQDGTVRRIQVKSGQVLVWCFNTEEDTVCN